MKKSLALLLALVLCLALAACGESAAPEATATPAATTAPETTAAPAAEPTAAASEPQEDTAAKIEQVKALIGQPVQALYDAIGEPASSDYGSSCLVKDAEDGSLYYDGFTVYTTRYPDGTETVYDVE